MEWQNLVVNIYTLPTKSNLEVEGMQVKLFTYGTLKRQKGDKMFGCEVLDSRNAVAEGQLFKVSWYPAMVLKKGFKTHGTLLTIEADPDFFKNADRYEGRGTLYKREKIEVQVDGHTERAEAWIWALPTKGLEPIENGRFKGGDS